MPIEQRSICTEASRGLLTVVKSVTIAVTLASELDEEAARVVGLARVVELVK